MSQGQSINFLHLNVSQTGCDIALQRLAAKQAYCQLKLLAAFDKLTDDRRSDVYFEPKEITFI